MERLDENLGFILKFENVAWYEDGIVKILDRRIYPIKIEYVTCKHHKEVAKAIADMVTQSGGPYAAAEMGMVQAVNECKDMEYDQFVEYMEDAAKTLSTARPTTYASMSIVVNKCLKEIVKAKKSGVDGVDIVNAAFDVAVMFMNDRYKKADEVAEHLIDLIPQNGTIMTQCFAEFYIGMLLDRCVKEKKNVRLICPETRPYFQGSRLTASLAKDMGIDVYVITDNMPATIIEREKVDLFACAADAVCMDGHIVNKVGTFQISLACQYHKVPFFVMGNPEKDYDTIDKVKIEERDRSLVIEAMGHKTSKDDMKAFYPAFDITPPSLISGIVTSKGIYAPYVVSNFHKEV